MGMTASQGRLLSITARLTSNEYESQQISNAKMRLATQSEEASSEYIDALNTQQLLFTSYDAQGSSSSISLTAGVLYQYADMKNQYVLANTSGQALVAQEDAYNFEKASNLDEFLAAYGIEKQWKSTSLQANAELLESAEFKANREAWDNAVAQVKKDTHDVTYKNDDGVTETLTGLSSDRAWEIEKSVSLRDYENALKDYNDAIRKADAGVDNEEEVATTLNALSTAKQAYTACITYDNWAKTKAAYNDDGTFSTEYLNMEEYNKVLEEYNAEAEDYGSTIQDLYTYNDATKAQWYTNLWYRLNGQSSEKSAEGMNKTNYSVLDSKLLDSSSWIQNALTKGAISIEVASNSDSSSDIPDINTPTVFNIGGITWKTTIYSSCTDITQKDDDASIAKAEAEYERKTQEINAKDEKYQNKIKNLDTEHTALQTEYESIQSALNKNIERSYKTFNG